MGNQLWSYSPYIAHAKNTGQRVVIFGLRGYRHLFPSLDQYDFIWVAPPRLSRVVNHLSWRLKTIGVKKMNIKIPGIPLRIMFSWNAPNFHALQKENASFIREVFALPDPPANFRKTNESRKASETIIGIHIRRGDYKQWRGGKYFYEFSHYKKIAEHLRNQINKEESKKGEKRVRFFLSSNEDLTHFIPELPDSFSYPGQSAVEDLACLSACDYIFGPSSTFSMWASYYGNVPLRILDPGENTISIDEFEPIIAFSQFASRRYVPVDDDVSG